MRADAGRPARAGRRGGRGDPGRRRAGCGRAGRRPGLRRRGRDRGRLRRGARGRVDSSATWSPRPGVTSCPVCGPNCNGIVADARAGRAVGRRADARASPARWRCVSQSGNVAVNALATRRGLRFHTVDRERQPGGARRGRLPVVPGPRDGRRLDRAVPRGRRRPGARATGWPPAPRPASPVVVLKVGAARRPARRRRPPTARALAGDQRIFRALIEEAGGVWAADVHELLEVAKALAASRARAALDPCARSRDHDLLGRRLGPGRRRGGTARARATGARAGDVRAPARAPADGRHRGQPARLHRDDLGRGRAARRARARRSARTRRSTRCSCSTTSSRA